MINRPTATMMNYCQSTAAVTHFRQQMADCSWIICMQQHARIQAHTIKHTQTHAAGASRMHRETFGRTEGFSALL